MQEIKKSPLMKIVAKAAEVAAEGWPADNCVFWTYNPKKPTNIPAFDAPKVEQK